MIEGNTTILLENGKVEVLKGEAEVFGCRGKYFEAPRGKILPVYFPEDSEARIEGNYIAVNGSTIPKSWEKFVENDWSRIFLYGAVDTGKSSFCVFVSHRLGIDLVLDADIGQADISHPGSMALGRRKEDAYLLSMFQLISCEFVGSISPMNREARCLRAFKKLVERAGEKLIIDTTGWIHGKRAVEYKLAKVEIANPEVIVCFSDPPREFSDYEVFKAESFVLKKRDREMRAYIRGKSYERWFENAREIEVSVDDVKLYFTSLFSGERVEDDVLLSFGDVIYAERSGSSLNIYSESFDIGGEGLKALKEYYNVVEVNVVSPKDFENVLVGLYSDEYLCPGLIREVNFEERKIKILASTSEKPKRIEFGEFKIENGREVFVRLP